MDSPDEDTATILDLLKSDYVRLCFDSCRIIFKSYVTLSIVKGNICRKKNNRSMPNFHNKAYGFICIYWSDAL